MLGTINLNYKTTAYRPIHVCRCWIELVPKVTDCTECTETVPESLPCGLHFATDKIHLPKLEDMNAMKGIPKKQNLKCTYSCNTSRMYHVLVVP